MESSSQPLLPACPLDTPEQVRACFDSWSCSSDFTFTFVYWGYGLLQAGDAMTLAALSRLIMVCWVLSMVKSCFLPRAELFLYHRVVFSKFLLRKVLC